MVWINTLSPLSDNGCMTNVLPSIDDLGLDRGQKCRVLEWFAGKVWQCLDPDDFCNGSTPLEIDGDTAYSGVFEFPNGDASYVFDSLVELEDILTDSMHDYQERTHDVVEMIE